MEVRNLKFCFSALLLSLCRFAVTFLVSVPKNPCYWLFYHNVSISTDHWCGFHWRNTSWRINILCLNMIFAEWMPFGNRGPILEMSKLRSAANPKLPLPVRRTRNSRWLLRWQQLADESARCTELQMMVDSKDADIEMLRNQFQTAPAIMDSISMHSEGCDDNAYGQLRQCFSVRKSSWHQNGTLFLAGQWSTTKLGKKRLKYCGWVNYE